MRNLYIYTIFEKENGRPRCTGIRIGDNIKIYDLYRSGARRTIADINKVKKTIRDLIIYTNDNGGKVVLSDFKSHIAQFQLPCDFRYYNVYDLHLISAKPGVDFDADRKLLTQILQNITNRSLLPYQLLISNSAVVYQELERVGLTNNYTPVNPIWSQKVYSGRSKTTGFNLQGFTDEHLVLPHGCSDHDILIHFDWICADIKAAALLSNDRKLIQSFIDSDPYSYMRDVINEDSDDKMSRDECKLFLLKSINSMDFNSPALSQIYTGLGSWIKDSRDAISRPNGFLETILGRRFYASSAKNNLAVLNGAMQGSVAHAMQNVIRQAWCKLPKRIVGEIHDSLVIASPSSTNEILSTISSIVPIMLNPFRGILESDPTFPVKISLGRRWRKWELFATYREGKIEYANESRDPQVTLKLSDEIVSVKHD